MPWLAAVPALPMPPSKTLPAQTGLASAHPVGRSPRKPRRRPYPVIWGNVRAITNEANNGTRPAAERSPASCKHPRIFSPVEGPTRLPNRTINASQSALIRVQPGTGGSLLEYLIVEPVIVEHVKLQAQVLGTRHALAQPMLKEKK